MARVKKILLDRQYHLTLFRCGGAGYRHRHSLTLADPRRGARPPYRFITVSVTIDANCPEWCTELCATAPAVSS